jgi:hypothetical protein
MNEADRAIRRITLSLLFLLCSLAAALGQEPYFPQGVLEDNSQGDSFRSNWYSKHLKALGEPSLFQMAKDSNENRTDLCGSVLSIIL